MAFRRLTGSSGVGGCSSRQAMVGLRVLDRFRWVVLVERAGDGDGNYPNETRMSLAHWLGSDCTAYALGQGVSR